MARPRKPSNVLALRGAFDKNPDRGRARQDEPKPVADVGDPPEHLAADVRACWVEIVELAHAGTLCSSDRLIVEHGAQLLAQLRADSWLVHPTLLIRWEGFLARLGMTPADRSKVSTTKKPAASHDPMDEFTAAQ